MKKVFIVLVALLTLLCACSSSEDITLESMDIVESSLIEAVSEDSSEDSEPESCPIESDPAESDHEEEAGFPYLVIGGVLVTEENAHDVFGDGAVSTYYDESADLVFIELNDAKINAMPFPDAEEIESVNGIYCEESISLTPNGKCEIIIEVPDIDYFYCYGIRTENQKTVTVCDGGKLDIISKGDGNAFTVCGIESEEFTLLNTELNIDIHGKKEVVGIRAEQVSAHKNDGCISNLTVKAESSGEENYAYGVKALKISSSNAAVDICGITAAPSQQYEGYSSTSKYFTYWEAPVILLNGDESEVILRGNVSVCYGNYFQISEGHNSNTIYVADNIKGKNAYKAKIINNEALEIFGKPYVKITKGKESDYGIWVCGKRITEKNAKDVFGDGTVSYDLQSETLMLNNARLIGGGFVDNHYSNSEAVIYSADSLNIELMGKNHIECTGDLAEDSRGLLIVGELVVSGDGELEIHSGVGHGIFGTSEAIFCVGYHQKSGKIRAIAGDAPDHHAYPESNAIYSCSYFRLEGGSFYGECGKAVYTAPIKQNSETEEFYVTPNAKVSKGKTPEGNDFISIEE